MFNIRVYGILINEKKQVLVSDEYIKGKYYTKFCGGGLEQGEGMIDCLKREFMEEMNLPVEVTNHLYTTDFYQPSAFNPDHQIISVYYHVKALENIKTPLRSAPFQFDEGQLQAYAEKGETETFRFIDWDLFSEESVTLPIDKIVASLIKKSSHIENRIFCERETVLENKRVRLEPLAVSHFESLLPIAMKKEIWEFTAADIRTETDFLHYFNTALQERKNHLSYPFAVYDKLHNRYGGCTRYGNISLAHKKVEIGWTWYDPLLQRSGINKACKYSLLHFGFETAGLNRIELKTSILNVKSQGAMLKIGATKEGILRKHLITDNGTVRDTVYFSFIADDWLTIRDSVFKEFTH
jgi:RimJ/RimL family protein N-acetyltransferase/8-oxo-dGTP pyrophosphatase MutT (NUDIX family)